MKEIDSYNKFIESKRKVFVSAGVDTRIEDLHFDLYEWQKHIVRWALKKGKAALFEDCGLGKTVQQLEWSRVVSDRTGGDIIIFAPLAVASQTKSEGEKFGINVTICRDQSDVRPGINIANYEIMEKFTPSSFVGIVLDESSILKHQSSKTRKYLTDAYSETPYKLCCTATPSPNDFMELGNHAEFLGVMSKHEMLATFFVHEGSSTQSWRLKGHAEDKFWEWISSWACVIENPRDIGFEAGGYDLPDLIVHETVVESELKEVGGQFTLFAVEAQTLSERRGARRQTIAKRVKAATEIANATSGQVLVWCDLNDESRALASSIDGAVEVAGSHSSDYKRDVMMGFSNGAVRCLVSKPSIAGWGMNWQNCSEMIFVGLSDSFESYYQAVRRCWRFGQTKSVKVHIIISDAEGAVKANIERKQRNADMMKREMIAHTKSILARDIRETTRITESYIATERMRVPSWLRTKAA
jgi:hypothetical protein